ncbi:MAG: hypothetical protein HRU29_11935 [Rhizobiales bacterium]|nr:hypothetical protein [Hyphomicrobiales bacterium]NRB15099.1 hypothetical protein [Hyphomicrobiales bacterium]
MTEHIEKVAQLDNVLKFIISEKMDQFAMVTNTSILWWATVIVLEASFIAGFVLKREEIKPSKFFTTAISLGVVFILLSVIYGLNILCFFIKFQDEMHELLRSAKIDDTIFDSVFELSMWAISLGDLSLVVFLVCLGYVIRFKLSRHAPTKMLPNK